METERKEVLSSLSLIRDRLETHSFTQKGQIPWGFKTQHIEWRFELNLLFPRLKIRLRHDKNMLRTGGRGAECLILFHPSASRQQHHSHYRCVTKSTALP